MNFRFTKCIFLSTLMTACSVDNPNSSIDKKDSTANSTVVDSSKNKNIEDGVYYIYKSCQYESKLSKPNCKQDEVEIWNPSKVDNNYVIRLNTSFDDFYLVKKDKNQEVYFYSNFIENPISGWFKATLTQNSNGFVLSRDHYFQNFGYKNDGSFDELPDYPYENMSYISINDREETYKVYETESIEFISYEDEYYIDCASYEAMNGNISGELFVSCHGKDALWLKKVK